jgi:ankyrin repeat protein
MYHRDIRYYCKDRPPLHYAIEFRIDSLVSMLLPHKDKIDDLVGGKSLLHVAARCGALTTIKQLISLGADVNRSSGAEEKCMTVLHFAAEGGHAEALKLLIKHGAMVDSRSTSLSTPFYRAARSGSLEALKTLYDAGADINAKTWDHWTPLFESISHGRRRIASQLLQWGADLTAVTLQGESTLMMLRRNRNEQILTENPGLSEFQREVMFVSEANILEEIEAIRKLGNEEEIKNGFDALVKGLAKQYILVLPIDKDTRPGTKREKDQRFPHDVSPTSSFFPVPLFRQALTSI